MLVLTVALTCLIVFLYFNMDRVCFSGKLFPNCLQGRTHVICISIPPPQQIARTDQQNCKETGISLNTVENNFWAIPSESLDIFCANNVIFQVTPLQLPPCPYAFESFSKNDRKKSRMCDRRMTA